VDLFVLGKQVHFAFETGHLLREHGEDVLFFDCVVDGQVVAELFAGVQEGAERHSSWSFAGAAGIV